MTTRTHRIGLAAVTGLILALQGCGTSQVSKNISNEGVAGEVVFPRIEQDAWLKEGTFPNLDNLRAVAPGMTKDQLFASFGRPHFREGMGGVREWDYVFNFRTGDGPAFVTCQYKVIFDTQGKAQTFHWLPASCADQLRKPMAAPAPKPAAVVVPVPQTITLGTDGLFRFGGGHLRDLLPEGRQRVEKLATDLRAPGRSVTRVAVTGHTDRIGSTSSNEVLSVERANTVRDLLVQNGVAGSVIRTAGMGERKPVVECKPDLAREALVACLSPNRRVEIEVSASQP